MIKKLHFKKLLLMALMLVGAGSAWAETKTEGFETADASTTYNSTKTYTTAESDCGIAWTMYYGTVSTNDKINGTKSAQMRWYSSAKDNLPYIMTTTAIDGLTNVALKARTSDKNVKMDVCYSANGTSWTVGKTHGFEATGVGENVSLDIPSGNKYVKFAVSSSSTAPESGNYKLIVDDVVFTYSSNLEIPTWSVNPASANVAIGESTTLQLTTNYNGTLAFESADEDIATVSYNPSTKVITVNGIAGGSTTITATGAATSTYEAISKNISVTVVHAELPSNVIDVMGSLGYSYFGLTGDQGTSPNEYAQPDEDSRTKTDAYGVTLLLEKGESSTNLRYDRLYLRIYQKSILTITAPTGSTIRKIVFIEPSSGKSWSGSFTVEDGDYVSNEKTWYATSEDVTSVEFLNDATKRIGGIEVYLQATKVQAVVTDAGWATWVAPCVNFGSTKAYIIDGEANMIEVTSVPANTPVLLEGAGTKSFNIIASSTTNVSANCLKMSDGTAKSTNAQPIYVLANGNEGVGFYKWAGAALSKGKVYLELPAAASSRTFIGLGGETTGIDNVNANVNDNSYFDLQGRRVAQPTKGLYIVNGKKVILK